MYAFRLPVPIPNADEPGGPPVESQRRQWFRAPVDVRVYALDLIRHPETMPVAMAEMTKQMTSGNFSPKK